MEQKFHRGDLVNCVDDRNPGEARIIGSYADQFGGSTDHSRSTYTLIFCEDGNEVSWFYEDQLTLIHKAEPDAIALLKAKHDARVEEQSNLDWIVAHWNPNEIPGASMEALAAACGLGSCWGTDGEGVCFYNNARTLIRLFDEPMRAGIDAVRAKIAEIKGEPSKIRWSNHLFRQASE